MRKSEEGFLLCKICDFDYMHLVGTIVAYDDDQYNLTHLVVDGKHLIECSNAKRYKYRSQGNIHLLYRCEDGHFSIFSFDGHKGVTLVDDNPLMDQLARFLNEKTKDERQLVSQMTYTMLGYIEDFLTKEDN